MFFYFFTVSVQLAAVLDPMRQVARVQHLHMLESFQDRDRKRLKAVTLSQFASVLKTYGLLPLASEEAALAVLQRAYPARHPENINYTKFVEDLEANLRY